MKRRSIEQIQGEINSLKAVKSIDGIEFQTTAAVQHEIEKREDQIWSIERMAERIKLYCMSALVLLCLSGAFVSFLGNEILGVAMSVIGVCLSVLLFFFGSKLFQSIVKR